MDTYKNTIKNDVMKILENKDLGNASGGTGEIKAVKAGSQGAYPPRAEMPAL